jgi:RNA polymerase sigma-70 factor (ECF subfamily)
MRRGDAAALRAVYLLHVDSVVRYARYLLQDREDAEEVAVDTFVRAFRSAEEFRGAAGLRSWLFSIARNRCIDRLRQPRLQLVEISEGLDVPAAQGADHADIRAAFSQLSEEYREVLFLCDVEEWTAREAAAVLSLTEEAVKSRLYRARRALRDCVRNIWQSEEADGLR